MRRFFALLLCLVLMVGHAYGRKHKYRGLPRDEVGLMNNVLGCLKFKDSVNYYYLFPPFDTLWQMVMHNPDHSPETVKALNELKEHPQHLLSFDPYYNHQIMQQFYNVLQKGEDSGLHWDAIVMQRYELVKQPVTRDLVGYDKIAPERFKGYMFVRDLLGHLTFCITITEIQKINGYFFGGQVLNVLEASSIDQFLKREAEEQRYFDWLAKHPVADSATTDSVKIDSISKAIVDDGDTSAAARKKKALQMAAVAADDESTDVRKEVVERHYYEGLFDQEIPVKLYVRYMKDRKKGATGMAYDGLYKFGDQEDYVRLTITRTPEGKWVMDDEQPIGSMDLELKNKIYTGSWTNNESQSGYDVVLKPAVIPEQKLEQLEKILEKGLSGRVDEDVTDTKGKKTTKQDDTTEATRGRERYQAYNRKAERREKREAKRRARAEEEQKEQKKQEELQKKALAKEKARKLDREMQKAEEDAEKKQEKEEEKREERKEKDEEKKDDEKKEEKKDDEPAKPKDDDGLYGELYGKSPF